MDLQFVAFFALIALREDTSCCCYYNCIEVCEFQRSAGRMWTVSLGDLLPVLGGA